MFISKVHSIKQLLLLLCMPTGTEVEVGLPNASLGSVAAISLALEKSQYADPR